MNSMRRWLRAQRAPAGVNTHDISFADALVIQRRVITALMVREALMRFGHENLGFFWIMGEPLLLTCGVMIMWTIGGMGHGHGVSVIPFALTGYTMLTLWRHLVGHMVHFMRHNAGLLFHRNIRVLDIISARVILECLGGLAAFFIAYVPLYLWGAVPAMDDPLLLLAGWGFMTWFGFGFGMIIAGATELSEAAERFVPPVMYITIPATGAFYMMSWLPDGAQKILAWSPLVHPFEMFRGGLFGSIVEAKYDVNYMVIVCIIVTAVGLATVRIAQKHVGVT